MGTGGKRATRRLKGGALTVLLAALLAHGSGAAAGNCAVQLQAIQLRENTLPDPGLINRVLACTGMERHIQDLDRLDRDLLLVRALHFPWEKFRTMESDIRDRAYGEFVPDEVLKGFFRFVQEHKASEEAPGPDP